MRLPAAAGAFPYLESPLMASKNNRAGKSAAIDIGISGKERAAIADGMFLVAALMRRIYGTGP